MGVPSGTVLGVELVSFSIAPVGGQSSAYRGAPTFGARLCNAASGGCIGLSGPDPREGGDPDPLPPCPACPSRLRVFSAKNTPLPVFEPPLKSILLTDQRPCELRRCPPPPPPPPVSFTR